MKTLEPDIPNHRTAKTVQFWTELERNVASMVGAALRAEEARRAAVIDDLRDLETMARAECDRRQTIQIIASGRSLLGDRRQLGPSDGPFARCS